MRKQWGGGQQGGEGRGGEGDNRELNEIMQSQTTTKTFYCK